MKFIDLKKSLRNGVLPAYNIVGDDMFLVYKSLELIRNVAVPSFPELNEIVFSENASYSINDVINACEALPFGQDLRLVIVKDCNLKSSSADIKALQKYIAQINNKTCLVFFNSDGPNEFVNKVKEVERIDCNKLSPDLVAKLINQKCIECDKAINIDAVQMLQDYCLNNLARIYNEIEKLIAYVGDEKIITTDDVEKNVVKELEFEGYEFAQAVASKNGDRALEILNSILTKKEGIGTVVFALYNLFSRMFFVSISKRTNADLAKILGVKEFAVRKTKELCSNFTKMRLKQIIEMLSLKEFELKSGKISATDLCEFLIFKIVNEV